MFPESDGILKRYEKEYGSEQHNGVKVIWDRDYDKRVFIFIDNLSPGTRKGLFSVSEHEGSLTLYWKPNAEVPFFLCEGAGGLEIYNGKEYIDYWSIYESKRLKHEDIFPLDEARIITKKDRYDVLHRQKWRCNSCHVKLKYSISSSWEGEVAHIDHIYPYSERWSYPNGVENINELANLQALCPKCNLQKWKNYS